MTEQVQQQICIKFCITLEHFFVEIIWMIQNAAAMSNWWLATSRQCIAYASHLVQSFLAKHQITQMTQPPYSLDLAPCNWLFPKLKSPFKGKRFPSIDEIQENPKGQLMAVGRTVWGPKVPTLKGTEASLSCVQCFLYLVSYINVSIFYITCQLPSGQTTHTPTRICVYVHMHMRVYTHTHAHAEYVCITYTHM